MNTYYSLLMRFILSKKQKLPIWAADHYPNSREEVCQSPPVKKHLGGGCMDSPEVKELKLNKFLCSGATSLFGKAFSTKYSCPLSRYKRHFIFFTTVTADDFCHTSCRHSFCLFLCPTLRTSKRWVIKTFCFIEFLLTGSPYKLFPTFFTN